MYKKITLPVILFFQLVAFSQVGIGTITPNSDSILELYSTDKGLLITRVNLSATTSFNPLTAHVAGMIVYNTATAGTALTAVTPGFYYNDGSRWIRLEPLTTTIGDTKYSLATTDHLGWYLLDGRAKATLSANAQTNATSIGFGVTIPNADDRILKAKAGAEALMATGGSNTVTLTQANLPNLNLAGTTSSNGLHSHSYNDIHNAGSVNLSILGGILSLLATLGLDILYNEVSDNTISTNAASISTSSGTHAHTATVSSGGSGTPISKVNHLVTNVFVYLGY